MTFRAKFFYRLLFGVCAAAISAAPPAEAQSADLTRVSLNQALAIALERNPIVVDSALEWRRTQGAAAGVAGVLAENPVVGAEGGVRRDTALSGPQASIAMRVDQPVDILGQAGTRRRAAEDVVSWAKSRLSLARAEIAARTHVLYVEAQVAMARVALGEERLATAKQTAEALEMQAQLGAASNIDLGMAEAELGRAQAAVENARALLTRMLLGLREVLDLPSTAVTSLADPLAKPPISVPDGSEQDRLLDHHLAIKVVDRRRIAVDSEIARLERERLPRFAFGFLLERASSQEDFAGLTFSFAPALWRRNQGPLAEARVERERTDFERATTLASLRRRWTALREEQQQRLRELSALEKTVEHEESVRTLVRSGWQAGKFDFLRVLLAERSLADTKQARLDLWADLWINVIEINRLLGKAPSDASVASFAKSAAGERPSEPTHKGQEP